jgi:putative membrane protein
MQHRSAIGLGLAVAAAAACNHNPPVYTASAPMSTAGGELVLNTGDGMWVDSVNGIWMDTSGTVWLGGRGGRAMDLDSVAVSMMTNANIMAHVATGDSLEIALSRAGAARARNDAVRAFANRMVSEHSQHLQTGRRFAMQAGIMPMPAVPDSGDARLATRMMNGLSRDAQADYDRSLMRDEVMMHQHMLRDLEMLRPQADGATREFIDQTLPVVRQHLADARMLWRQVGGGVNMK